MSQERLSTAGDRQRWTGGFPVVFDCVLNSCRGCQVILFDVHMVLPPFLQDICRRGRGPGTWKECDETMVFGKRLDIFSPRRWSDASSWPNQRLPREMVGDPSVRASIVWVSWFWGYGIITCHFRRMWFCLQQTMSCWMW